MYFSSWQDVPLGLPSLGANQTAESFSASTLSSPEVISLENIDRLALVDQWGKGEIMDVAYAPDGSVFVIASNFGAALYDPGDLLSPPAWVPFPGYINYEAVEFSLDGKQLLLAHASIGTGQDWHREALTFDLETGIVSEDSGEVDWYQPAARNPGYSNEWISLSPGKRYLLTNAVGAAPPAIQWKLTVECTTLRTACSTMNCLIPSGLSNMAKTSRPMAVMWTSSLPALCQENQ